ncbi:MAG: NusG domain II-containing protein [Sarcina sp.]
MKLLRKCDILLILFLVFISFLPYFLFLNYTKKNYNSTYAEIKVEGKLFKTINLSAHKGLETLELKTKEGVNKIIIKDNSISIEEAHCSDSICIKQGFIKKVGENIICLPQKIIIEIKGEESDNSEEMILSQ